MIIEKLAGSDRRSIGRADEVAAEIAGDQALFDEVFAAIFEDDPVIRMRAADAVEKASRRHPERLLPHKQALLNAMAGSEQPEVRWHLAQMLPRLPLRPAERVEAVAVLEQLLRDKSAIVRVNALAAIMVLAQGDAELEADVFERLARALESGSAAEKARAGKLLKDYYHGAE